MEGGHSLQRALSSRCSCQEPLGAGHTARVSVLLGQLLCAAPGLVPGMPAEEGLWPHLLQYWVLTFTAGVCGGRVGHLGIMEAASAFIDC